MTHFHAVYLHYVIQQSLIKDHTTEYVIKDHRVKSLIKENIVESLIKDNTTESFTKTIQLSLSSKTIQRRLSFKTIEVNLVKNHTAESLIKNNITESMSCMKFAGYRLLKPHNTTGLKIPGSDKIAKNKFIIFLEKPSNWELFEAEEDENDSELKISTITSS
ncbi:hypothetical protein CHS0354_042544 [Potamilus streckersoni]|uniref:Uncharacterized protein n=1 Tax=Potamilus streckersoni TaxID=2493646 RepID=A0AAE0TES6_9BIVA|nr:hypothetical protein CHS0354_042544 [Potamilus streckersoni]